MIWKLKHTACASHISDVLIVESNFPLISTQVGVDDLGKNQIHSISWHNLISNGTDIISIQEILNSVGLQLNF